MLDQYKASKIKPNLTPYILSLPNEQLTDEQLIEKTKELEEVKFLLAKYPTAAAHVSRMYLTGSPYNEVGVQYSADKNVLVDASTGYSEPFHLLVDVRYERETNKSLGASAYCLSPQPHNQELAAGHLTAIEIIESDYCFKPAAITGVGNQY